MEQTILADQVRAFAYTKFLQLHLTGNIEIALRAGDVHSAMQFTDRVPLVVAALRARRFCEQFGLELVRKEGPRVSSTTTFTFRLASNDSLPGATGVTWAEVTSREHGHGGSGWELGRWLWSPIASKDGADRYAVMLQPRPGDQVFHLVSGVSASNPRQRFLYGVSTVAASAEQTTARPPLPGAWRDADAYYRIALKEFSEFATKLAMDEFEEELSDVILADLSSRPKYYPYAKYRTKFRGSQGIYLARLSSSLAEAFRVVSDFGNRPAETAATLAKAAVREFSEGERSKREQAFFKRNPALRQAAIDHHGVRCMGCTHAMEELYGAIGVGLIDIHHLNPLAERARSDQPVATTVEDLAPLCPNCHRIVHRTRPPLSISELQAIVANAGRLTRQE